MSGEEDLPVVLDHPRTILEKARGEDEEPPEPSPDLVALRKRYVPERSCFWCRFANTPLCPQLALGTLGTQTCKRFGWNVSLEDYGSGGRELVEGMSDYAQVLGEYIEFGWRELLEEARRRGAECRLNGEPIRTRTQWALFCGTLFGLSRSAIVKAWTVGRSELEPPADVGVTFRYLVESASSEPAERERLMDKALGEGWSTWQLRTVIYLRKQGFTKDWCMPRIVVDEDDCILLEKDGDEIQIGELYVNAAGIADVDCALAMLMRGVSVVVKTKKGED